MTEPKYTKGPWIAAPYSSVVGAPVVSRMGRSIASVTYFKLGEHFQNHDSESEANGHLIAAAPELLEALKEARENLWNYWVPNTPRGMQRREELLRKYDAAIAKAEGRS